MKKKFIALLLAGFMTLGFSAMTACTNDPADEGDGSGGTVSGDNSGDNSGGTVSGDNSGGMNNGDNSGGTNNGGGNQTVTDTSTPLTGKVYFVGDSTVCSFSDAYYLPRYGYGTQFYNYLNCEESQIVNLALSGRSSYSFTTDTSKKYADSGLYYYDYLVENISEGDYLIIGFGHNDEKDGIYTNPNLATDSTEQIDGRPASFRYSLYNNYIKVAEDAGATPILCTPIVRANKDNDYSGSSAHIRTTSDGGANPGGDWAQAIRDLGEEKGVDVVDLTAITKADYTELGYEKAMNYHAFTAGAWTDDTKTEIVRKDASIDTTHTNMYGAKMNAYYIASELLKTDNPLAAHIKTNITKPTYENDYAAAISKTYAPKDYAPFNSSTSPTSGLGALAAEDWYATVFGYMGSTKMENYSVSQNTTDDESISITVADLQDKTKLDTTNNVEGIVCAFTQLDSNATFTFSAEVTINTYNDHNQTGFGVMLRDDIYIDTSDSSILSNYAAAGVYGKPSAANILYTRENEELTPVNTKKTLSTTTTHTLSITRVGKTVTVAFDGYSQDYPDFDVVAIDNDYMYICLYAMRGTSVTFNNINLQITGTSQA